MESLEQTKARLENIRGIEPILTALRTIALGGLRTTLRRLENARVYYAQLQQVLRLALEHLPHYNSSAIHQRCGRCALLIVGSQRGLCGPFTSMVADASEQALRELQAEGVEVEIMVLGEHAHREMRRRGFQTAWEGRLPITSAPSFGMATELAEVALRRYEDGELEAFYVTYNHYLGAGRYEPRKVTLIPFKTEHPLEEPVWPPPIVETDVRSLYKRVARQLVALSFYQVLLASAAAEHSARFQLMDGASQNSRRLIEELTLAYHTARQQAITQEMLELAVSAGLVSSPGGWRLMRG